MEGKGGRGGEGSWIWGGDREGQGREWKVRGKEGRERGKGG